MYVLTNGIYYCGKSDDCNGRIIKIQNLEMAFKFETKEDATKELNKASSKLKGFNPLEIESALQELPKVKVIPAKTESEKVCKRIWFTPDTRKIVYRKSQGNCCLCGKFVDYEEFTIDHIIPLGKGGTNEQDNLQCACKVCNNIKTDVLPDEFTDKITDMIIYSMNQKYNKVIGRKMFHMLITANLHRFGKHK